MSETRLVEFRDGRGALTVINPAHVASIQDDYHQVGGGYYSPGCTVVLSGGEKIRLYESASSAMRKLAASLPSPGKPE